MIAVFHTYGLIVGIAIVTAITLIEKQYKKLGYSENNFLRIITFSLIFGVIGARLWHVATDFFLYDNNLREVFFIWNGGLSIFGGVLGGVFGVYLTTRHFSEFLDIAVFGLPIGQAIGRLGNYVNQELYGFPTGDSVLSIFKIYISPENRLPGYENVEYYHPIFFYEMIAMIVFSSVIYYLSSKKKLPKIGTGKLFLIYLLYYSTVRFLLDFVRLDKTMVSWLNIGVNQMVLLIVAIFSICLFFKKSNKLKIIFVTIFIFITASVFVMSNLHKPISQETRSFSEVSDREFVSIMIGNETELRVEVVNSSNTTQQGLSGRDKIGSDGMLFIFPESYERVFWMFDMKFNLDIVWINDDKIVGVTKNIKKPAPNTSNQDIERVSINEYSNKVLELNAGDIEKYKIEVGDVVILK